MPASGPAPIFYDPAHRRRPFVVTLALLISLAGTVFCISLVLLPLLPAVSVPKPHFAQDVDLTNPALVNREISVRRFLLTKEKAKLTRLANRERAGRAARRAQHAKLVSPPGAPIKRPVVAAFYVDWDETSLASLRVHADELTHLMPEWLHLRVDPRKPHAPLFTTELKENVDGDPAWEALKVAREHGLAVVPLLNNYVTGGVWDQKMLKQLLEDPDRCDALISQLKSYLLNHHLQGINVDFEEVPEEDSDALTEFMTALHDALAPAGLLVTEDVPVDDDTYQLSKLAPATDFLMPMLYDQHYSQSGPGPIAPQKWFQTSLDHLCHQVPPDKLVLSLGNYAYDWRVGAKPAQSMTFQAAIVTAQESQDTVDLTNHAGKIDTDPSSLNPHYFYFDDGKHLHQVWMLDAVTAFNQWHYGLQKKPLGVGLWYLGSEDPSLWTFFGRTRLLTGGDPRSLTRVHYGFQIDFEGEGEILSVRETPQEGQRTLAYPHGIIRSERWDKLPSSYVIRRWGRENNKNKVALTFDDGPDAEFTPQILDILERENVHATFFMIGRNAEANAGLTRRIWNEGNEVGNHTFNHPNLAETSPRRTTLELNATQRALESITGHSTPLFRPPYEADAEPETEDQVLPIYRAEKLGYIMIGESIDPKDWDTAHHVTARQIVERVMEQLKSGNCILLHDGGGDRSATVAALPEIIHTLKANDYRFVTVSQLMGRTREQLFHPIVGSETLLVGADRFVFDTAFWVDRSLRFLFVLSIVLGLSRIGGTAVLAILQSRRSRHRRFDPSYHPRVSVVIAAYNEAKVIRRTIETVLGGVYRDLEVVVVDDGSSDGTAEVVQAAFGGDSRVRVIVKENGGKASALNRGLEHATGEVIVALDADTLFDRWTIDRLVRHFGDPRVGAVAGNVKVGNTTNMLTRWQAIEYITSQNFDRRAFDLLNCITVVPGAVGAWRREAIEQAGGYSSQTLAEDTDLTWSIRKRGYRIVTENEALAYTEAPDGLRALAKQRFRWAFGTLQNLWKHRDALLNPRYGAFGLLALPGLWLYQITFQAIAPAVDLMILSSLFMGDVRQILFYYALFFVAELIGGLVAFSLERENKRLLIWMFWQRFIYRQLMYYVIVRSILRALGGSATGWGKLDRKGTSRVRGESPGEALAPGPQESLV